MNRREFVEFFLSNFLCENNKIGLNYYDVFDKFLKNQISRDDIICDAKIFSNIGVRSIRVPLLPYWPRETSVLFLEQISVFNEKLGIFIEIMESYNVRVVFSVFFNAACISDLAGDPISFWAVEGSKTRSLAKSIIDNFINVCKWHSNSKILEFANEFNTFSEVRDSFGRILPPVNVNMGTPALRDDRDIVNIGDSREAFRWFSDVVKNKDDGIFVSSGFNVPRGGCMNRYFGRMYDNRLDELVDYVDFISDVERDGFSVHLYEKEIHKNFNCTVFDALKIYCDSAISSRKSVFVGEFGIDDKNKKTYRNKFEEFFNFSSKMPIKEMLLWVYNYHPQEKTWSFSAGGEKSWILDVVKEFNRK